MSPQTADLVIAVRKGHAAGLTIGNSPKDDSPVILQPHDGGTDVRVGGPPPGDSSPAPGHNRDLSIINQVGPSQDSFEVYLGGVEHPLDSAPVWRYLGENALDAPAVAAVSAFQKAIDESEKQRQQNHK